MLMGQSGLWEKGTECVFTVICLHTVPKGLSRHKSGHYQVWLVQLSGGQLAPSMPLAQMFTLYLVMSKQLYVWGLAFLLFNWREQEEKCFLETDGLRKVRSRALKWTTGPWSRDIEAQWSSVLRPK